MSQGTTIIQRGYKKTALKGVSWMSAFRISTRAMTFAKTIVLARVLHPAQFGVFGIASFILALLEILTETGINIVLIQSKNKKTDYFDSAWVISILRGIIISLLLIALSPFIASFFNTQEVLPVLIFMSLVPFVRGFINPAIINYQKELEFNKEFWLRSSIFLFDATITIILAFVTHSVFSLVWGLLAGALLEVLLSFILIKPRPKFRLQRNYFSEIFHKGKWVTAYGIFQFIAQEGDKVVVGKLLGASTLGIYQMAFKISVLPISEVTEIVNKVIFPVYTKIADDKKRLRRAFTKSTILMFLITLSAGVIIFLFPEQIVKIVLGPTWISAAQVLQILVVYGILKTITSSASSLFLGIGKQNYVTVMTFVRLFGLGITIYPLVNMFGVVGAGYSALISVLVELPLVLYFIFVVFHKKS